MVKVIAAGHWCRAVKGAIRTPVSACPHCGAGR